jgi:hypothetical protein
MTESGPMHTELNRKVLENKKDMKPFHIDHELECPILFKDILSCLRMSYPVKGRPILF